MKRLLATTCLCLSLFVIGVYGQQPDAPLTNASVIRLVKAGFKEKTVIAIINNRPGDFKLDTEHLIDLKHNGVNENIILAMLSSQMGTVMVDENEWSSEDPFFKDLKKPSAAESQTQSGIFGSGSSSRSESKGRGGLGGNQNEGTVTGSATVRIIKPPVEAGFSEGTIIKRIEESPVDFDLSPTKVDELHKRRVTDAIIAAMTAAMGDAPTKQTSRQPERDN